MMSAACEQYRDDLSSYLDEQLDVARKADIAEHVLVCTDCRGELDSLKSTERLLARGLNPDNLDVPDIWQAVCAHLPSVCEVVQEDLSAYIDGELPPAAQDGVNVHLKECDGCRERFSGFNSLSRLVSRGLKLPENLEVDLWAAVKSRLNEDCALIQSELSAFVDQEVATLRHRSITAHLLDCPTCRGQFDNLSGVGDAIRSYYMPVMPEGFDLWPEIKAKMQVIPFPARSKPRARVVSHRLYLVGAAAVVAGVVGSLAFFFWGASDSVVRPVSAEAYLLESALMEPGDTAEAVVYENQ